jgi:hypothetical protein
VRRVWDARSPDQGEHTASQNMSQSTISQRSGKDGRLQGAGEVKIRRVIKTVAGGGGLDNSNYTSF